MEDLTESKLGAFLDSLQPPKTIPDYAVLFGGLDQIQPQKHSKNSNLSDLFASASLDIDSEVKNTYCQNIEYECDMYQLQPLAEISLITSNESSKLDKQRQDDETNAYWTQRIEEANLDNESVGKFLSIEDCVFEAVIRGNKDIAIETLERVILVAIGRNGKVVSKTKLSSLAEYGLLPKMCQANVVLRNILPLYKQILAADGSVVVKHILMPMIRSKVSIPRPLYAGVDKDSLFCLVMAWMNEELLELSVSTINALNELLQCKKQLNEYNCDILIKTLEHSVRYKPEDKDIAFFFRFVIEKFGWNMQEDQLKRLKLLSDIIQVSLKNSIQMLIQSKLDSLTS